MADAAARREARKRRILENSEKRLERITGAYKSDVLSNGVAENEKSDCFPAEPTSDIGSNCAEIPPVIKEASAPTSGSPTRDLHFSPSQSNLDCRVEDEMKELPQEDLLTPDSAPKEIQNTVSSLLSTKIHVVLLAVLVRIAFQWKYEFLFDEAILIPFSTLKLAEIFMSSKGASETGGGIISVAVLLCGVPPRYVSLINKLLHIFRSCLTDFYIYFFMFVITHLIFLYSHPIS